LGVTLVAALIVASIALATTGCRAGGVEDKEPTPDTRDRSEIILDLSQQLDRVLRDAEARGIITDGERLTVLGHFANRARPAATLIGRLVEVAGDSITIRTFVSLDDNRYLSGDLYTFTIGPDTKVLRGPTPVSASSFMRDEIMTIHATTTGIAPNQVIVPDRLVGLGVLTPFAAASTPAPNRTPSRDQLILDITAKIDARLKDAEALGIITAAERAAAIAQATHNHSAPLLGRVTAVNENEVSFHTFVSIDQGRLQAGDPWTFRILAETVVRRGQETIQATELRLHEIILVEELRQAGVVPGNFRPTPGPAAREIVAFGVLAP
jgi:hypothetical protein